MSQSGKAQKFVLKRHPEVDQSNHVDNQRLAAHCRINSREQPPKQQRMKMQAIEISMRVQ